MTRLVVFTVFSIAILVALSLYSYSDLSLSNERFNYDEYRKSYEEKITTIAELKRKRYEREHGLDKKEEKAEEETEPKEPVVVLETESEKRGQEIYKRKCIICHGKHGGGKKSQNAPKIAGQYAWYIHAQLTAMKNEERINKVMMPYLKTLNEQDFEDLGNFLAKYEW